MSEDQTYRVITLFKVEDPRLESIIEVTDMPNGRVRIKTTRQVIEVEEESLPSNK